MLARQYAVGYPHEELDPNQQAILEGACTGRCLGHVPLDELRADVDLMLELRLVLRASDAARGAQVASRRGAMPFPYRVKAVVGHASTVRRCAPKNR